MALCRHTELALAATTAYPIGVRGRVGKDVHQAARACCDGVLRALPRSDVDDRQLSTRFRRGDGRQRCTSRLMVGKDSPYSRSAIIVDDLDVVQALGDARVDERDSKATIS